MVIILKVRKYKQVKSKKAKQRNPNLISSEGFTHITHMYIHRHMCIVKVTKIWYLKHATLA
jgi:hypothetical protein